MEANGESETGHLRRATVCGLAVLAAFVAIFLLSKPFEYRSGLPLPILAVVGILLFAAVASFVGLASAIRVPKLQYKNLLLVIIGLAISIRLVALFTCPILEIDYYRYLWDGKVLAQSVSPYQFSPAEIRDGLPPIDVLDETDSVDTDSQTQTSREDDLERLVLLSIQSESNNTILNRIHYEEYTTIYPPVSQVVFGLTMKWIPDSASVEAHIIAIKLVLVLFDLATVAVVLWILWSLGFHPGWLILYAWNPLVIKEVANSGHLDSIATLFLMLSVLAIVKFQRSETASRWIVVWGGVALGLGVGAKLAPAILFPALAVMIARCSLTKSLLFSATCFAVVAISLSPMLASTFNSMGGMSKGAVADAGTVEPSLGIESGLESEAMGAAVISVESSSADNKDGLVGFFSKWRMNDPIFSTVYLNLKSDKQKEGCPWFVVTSSQWRDQFCDWLKARGLGGSNPAFVVTRGLTLGMFAVFYLSQLLLIFRTDGVGSDGVGSDGRGELYNNAESQNAVAKSLGRLAWIMSCFLVFQPTVNPWYFVWIAPLICFTRNRAWALATGMLLTYYARFWFKSLSDPYSILGCTYTGEGLFDHIFVFVEFGLIAALLVYFGSKTYENEGS